MSEERFLTRFGRVAGAIIIGVALVFAMITLVVAWLSPPVVSPTELFCEGGDAGAATAAAEQALMAPDLDCVPNPALGGNGLGAEYYCDGYATAYIYVLLAMIPADQPRPTQEDVNKLYVQVVGECVLGVWPERAAAVGGRGINRSE